MSVVDWLREGGRLAIQLAMALLGWCAIAPIALLMPRRKDWIAVIGRNGGIFTDNTKYFFLQAQAILPIGSQCVWVTEHRQVLSMLHAHKLPVLAYPSWKGAWLLLRAGSVVVDSCDWYLHMRRFFLCGAEKIQLWHGVGFKRIEDDKAKNEASSRGWISAGLIANLRIIMRNVTGRNVRYSLVNTTSQFYLTEVFRPAFSSDYFSAFGYPRNNFDLIDKIILGADAHFMKMVQVWKNFGRRIVLITPTFRESRCNPMRLNAESCTVLERWCEVHHAELVFKFHPCEPGQEYIRGNHLHFYDPMADLYPLIRFADAMVTDYSSIYMDFLILDKPVIFFNPDLDEYIRQDRQLQFDYMAMTPGPKVSSWTDLLAALEAQWRDDTYAAQRQALAKKAFDDLPQSETTPKLLAFMMEKGWLKAKK